jgi:hypothetical protein
VTLDALLLKLADQWPLIAVLAIVAWLSLPQLAERFAIIGKLSRPLSRRWREKAERLETQRKATVIEEARRLAAAAMKEMTPPDVAEMERRMQRLDKRLETVQDAEDMLRAFVIYDELWHFRDDHDEARRGHRPVTRMAFDTFEAKWQDGWRPFDDNGKLVDDGSA